MSCPKIHNLLMTNYIFFEEVMLEQRGQNKIRKWQLYIWDSDHRENAGPLLIKKIISVFLEV